MEEIEYNKMYAFEDGYWWYQGLHDLVHYYVQRAPGGVQRRILDAGCGTGRTLERMADLGLIEGIDYSSQAIALCHRRGIREAKVSDLNTWQGEAESYDVVISLDVICTDGIDDDTAVLRKLHGVLKPGGDLILNLPAFPLLHRRHDLAVSSVRRYLRNTTIRKLKALGFEIKRAGYRLPWLFPIILVRKLFEWRSDDPIASDLSPLPSFLNTLFSISHRLDNLLFTLGVPWPLGSSLFVVCRKGERRE